WPAARPGSSGRMIGWHRWRRSRLALCAGRFAIVRWAAAWPVHGLAMAPGIAPAPSNKEKDESAPGCHGRAGRRQSKKKQGDEALYGDTIYALLLSGSAG